MILGQKIILIVTEETISIANKAAVTEVEKILKTLADGNVL